MASPAPTPLESPAPNASPRILLVDDDENVRRSLGDGLRLRGFRVDLAESGQQAMTQLEADGDYHAVVSDVFMDNGDGFEVLNLLGKRAGAPPVVLMSGGSHLLGNAQCLNLAKPLGAAGVLHKPFPIDALLDLLGTSQGS